MRTLTVTQWGNGQAIRLDKTLLSEAGIKNGSRLNVTIEPDGTIVMKPIRRVVTAKTIDELFSGYEGDYHGEELPTGSPVGEEII